MAAGVREIAALPDPVGEELERRTLDSGLDLRKVRVPLGVVAVIYEARPNVTVDCAALCLKSGNAIVLRGSSYAERSNAALAALVAEAVAEAGLPEGAVELLAGDRSELEQLATAEGLVELVIPRGGEGLKQALKSVATVPVLYAAGGNCHVYVHADADLEMARRIAYNAKVDRPGRLQRGRDAARACRRRRRVPAPDARRAHRRGGRAGRRRARAIGRGRDRGRRGDRRRLGHRVPRAEDRGRGRRLARGGDRARERAHAPATPRRSSPAPATIAAEFTEGVDAAVVFVNASTRFTDGFVFGMGAEIGNSTQKLHARGPIGLRELTTTQVRRLRRRPGAGLDDRRARRPRRGLQPAAHRPPRARSGGGLRARPRPGPARPLRRGAAQPGRARARGGGAAGDDPAGGRRRRAARGR